GLSCTLCGDCLGACGHGCLGYRLPGLSPAAARMVFLVLAVSLHAVFLGVARI
ncbi:MAG TPA: 4Fe-4S ferredoxin, partial [Desulfovibrio sp.]|nr:4Fe-4S ferredoxin [Desulfovibrio sp.]